MESGSDVILSLFQLQIPKNKTKHPLPTPKIQEQNQTQNPKQIPISILVIWRRRGSIFAKHSSIDFVGLLTSFFFSSYFSLFLVQSRLTFFFLFSSYFSLFLIQSKFVPCLIEQLFACAFRH